MSTSTVIPSTWQPTWPWRIASRVSGELLFWLIILQIVGGLYLQSQLALFGGRVLLPNLAPKVGLVACIWIIALVVLVHRRGEILVRSSFLPACLFTCYLVLDLVYLWISGEKISSKSLLLGFNKYFLFFMAIPAAAVLPQLMEERRVVTRLTILFIPLCLLGLAQFVANDPLLPTVSDDDSFNIPAVTFFGQFRAFSLFRDPLTFGQALAFFAGILIAQIAAPTRRRLWITVPLLVLTAAACFVTYRRGAYVECGAAGLAAVAITRRWAMRNWLPWAYLAFGLLLASAGTVMSKASDGVLSSDTLAERQEAWTTVLDRWLMREDTSLLFGTGIAQIEGDDDEFVLVDNAFLSVGMEIGLIGLALWCWLMHSLWRETLALSERTGSALAISAAALLCTWMLRGMFDPLFAWYPLYVFLIWWTRLKIAPPAPASLRFLNKALAH